jgi:hypothetical protein
MDEEIGRVRIPLQYVSRVFLFVSFRVVLGRSFSCVVSLRGCFFQTSIEIALSIEMVPLRQKHTLQKKSIVF